MDRNWAVVLPAAIISLVMGGVQTWKILASAPAAVGTSAGVPPEPSSAVRGSPPQDVADPPLAGTEPAPPHESGDPIPAFAGTGSPRTDAPTPVRPELVEGERQAQGRQGRRERVIVHDLSRRIRALTQDRRRLADRLAATLKRQRWLKRQVQDLQRALGDLKRRLAISEALLSVRPEDPEAERRWAALGQLEDAIGLSLQDKSEQALAGYQKALELHPGLVEGWAKMGMELIRLGRYSEAAEALRQAIRLNPGDAAAHYNLGLLLEAEPAQAFLHYRIFLALAPDDPDAPWVRHWMKELLRYKPDASDGSARRE